MSITSFERQGTSTKKPLNLASRISRATSLLTLYVGLALRARPPAYQ